MRKAKTSNHVPARRVDKMGSDFRGDPFAALLEVLDSEAETHVSNDHLPRGRYDLSSVMFITRANTLNIPPPLMDAWRFIASPDTPRTRKGEIRAQHMIPETAHQARPCVTEMAIDDAAY